MPIKDRVEQLRKLMEGKGIDAYIIPSADYHQSEYVGEFFKSRQYISGFTGSAGIVIVTKNEAILWTDGRYFIQAEQQLENSGIKLFKMGEEGVPTTDEYLVQNMKDNSTLGFDGKTISADEVLRLEEKLKSKNVKIEPKFDLINDIWKDRPSISKEKAFLLDVKYAGKSFEEKLVELREKIKEKNATVNVLTSLDDIAWLFNLRGGDVLYNPVVLSYAVITLDSVYLFTDKDKLNDEILHKFSKENINLKTYEEITDFVKNIDKSEKVLLDKAKVNYLIYSNIPSGVEKIQEVNPTTLLKSKKNNVEINNLINSHVKDGVAVTKFMYWVKTNIGKIEMSEISASKKLEEFRREQEGFIEPSFSTIIGYKEHAAMMHYSPTEESNYKLEPEHMLLIDSGGQYFDGTTDITRTLVLGQLSDELKLHFTAVARSMINLAKAKFLQGVRGINLDILARGPIWNLGIDYKCGTGHGVGFLLNVHEGPNGFRWKAAPGKLESAEFEEGMVTTDEPGIYIEGSHGIRTENELVTRLAEKNEYGQFMNFEVITYAPIDLDGIDAELMNKEEKEYLNSYHKTVYDKVSPFLTEAEREWLKEYTRVI